MTAMNVGKRRECNRGEYRINNKAKVKLSRYCHERTRGRGDIQLLLLSVSRVSSGSIVSDYGLDDRAIGVRSPAGAKVLSSNLCVQTGSGAHPASCTMGTGGPFPWG
jgi:hypothetical protein